jgi:hypothetical protein
MEEHELRLSQNRMLRREVLPKGDDAFGGWRRVLA